MGLFNKLFESKQEENYELVESQNNSNYDENLPVTFSHAEQTIFSKLQAYGDLGNKIADFYMENKRINANIKALKIQTNAVIKIHAMNIKAAQEAVLCVFSERTQALNKHYEVLDKALKENDRDLILVSLQGISSIVVSNPIEQIAQYVAVLQNPKQQLKLDF